MRVFYNFRWLYGAKPRYKPFYNLRFNNLTMDIADGPSFVWQYKEIFVDEAYKFQSSLSSPIIYDCGANIGTSVLYFKSLYPTAKITAFEADKNIFEFLIGNIKKNNLNNIALIDKAVWTHNNGVKFSPDCADGGAISSEKGIEIPSIRLKDLLSKEEFVDMLKIDIEGAETEVIIDCDEELKKVNNIFIEYHARKDKLQSLSTILNILEKHGFRYFIDSVSQRNNPFINKSALSEMDLQLNVFGYRI